MPLETALHLAISESQMWSFQLLLKASAKLNVKNSRGEGLMHYAANGIGNAVHYITYLQKEGVPVDQRDKNGRTPLMLTALNGKPRAHRVVQTLLKCGADINAKDNEQIGAEEMFLACEQKSNKARPVSVGTAAAKESEKQRKNKREQLEQEKVNKTNNLLMIAYFVVPLVLIILMKVFEKQLSGPIGPFKK